jgi:hypothetical protein
MPPSSRRTFLKGSAVASATVALGAIPGSGTILKNDEAPLAAEPPTLDSPSVPAIDATPFTRGLGVYPGDPRGHFSPEMVVDKVRYRNLARLRPAYHSSSYDYNLTAQLVTDGIKDTDWPDWVATSTNSAGVLPKVQREFVLDHAPTTATRVQGTTATVQIQLGGGKNIPEVDRVDIVVIPPYGTPKSNLEFTVSVSDDARTWKKAGSVSAPEPAPVEGYPKEFARPGQLYIPSVALAPACSSRFYQIGFGIQDALAQNFYLQWRVGEIAFFSRGQRVNIGGPHKFTSAWMSEGLGEEWVYVDLGALCTFDRVKLHWIARAAEGAIQVSDDAEKWTDLHHFASESSLLDDVKLPRLARGRYVRVLMTRPTSPDGYVLSEIEVYGRGGPVARPRQSAPKPAPIRAGQRCNLAEQIWRVQRSSLVTQDGASLSKPGIADADWILATVPGTVLCSYLNVHAIPDPNFGKNQLYISDSYFYSDFWYRTEFIAPSIDAGQNLWLNFDGINWKAEIFLNGGSLGRIDGAFLRGRFDVTNKLRASGRNALAVRIEKNDTPGSCKQKTWQDNGPNGGAPGADNPTYHASVGWDWIPTIRGRNTGIIGDVYLTATAAVTIDNAFVTTALPLPDTSRADVTIAADLVNHKSAPVAGKLRGRFGDVEFEQSIQLESSGSKPIRLDPSTHPALQLSHPRLWWPVGYGDPTLYDVDLRFELEDGTTSDIKTLQAGIRQMSYKQDDGALKIWINGRRFISRGGNWGFSESMLRYRAREYDATLRYHREMNFNMIRNWVGQIGDNEFYKACDRHGVMVWQDFWLANPWDGPDPDDNQLFLSNVRDTVLRIRNHPSIGIYCGRNEGFPPQPLEEGIQNILSELHPGLHYIASSADNVVGGGGPYAAMSLTYYPNFAQFPKLHSEIGMPTIPSAESVRAMISKDALWPPGLEWGLHDFCEGGAPRGENFMSMLEQSYGGTDDLEEWVSLAQFVDYEGFRAEFEAQSKYRMGLLLWMSHPCWPSFLWQTYDYYLEPMAAYFACRNVCEPLHIQWNRVTDAVEVVNYNAGNVRGLTATAEVLNIDGSRKWKNSAVLDSAEDSATTIFQMEYPPDLTSVHFVGLTLLHGESPISNNLYLRGVQEGNFRAIRQLPKVRLETSTQALRRGEQWMLTTQVKNPSAHPALMVKLTAVRETHGDRILPAIYNDNYFTLLPGEQRTIQTELNHSDTRGQKPRMRVGGFNVDGAST